MKYIKKYIKYIKRYSLWKNHKFKKNIYNINIFRFIVAINLLL